MNEKRKPWRQRTDLHRLPIGKSTVISAISRPACDWAGCCGMWGNGYQEERKMKEILMEVILHLPHDTILRLFPLSRYCHFAGVLT